MNLNFSNNYFGKGESKENCFDDYAIKEPAGKNHFKLNLDDLNKKMVQKSSYVSFMPEQLMEKMKTPT